MTEPVIYKGDGKMLVDSKTVKCSYSAETSYIDITNTYSGKVYEYKKPDYSKMYFEFRFKDGEVARYRMDKDCHNLEQFLARMNRFHTLEKQLKIAKKALKEIEQNATIEQEQFGVDNAFCLNNRLLAHETLKEIEEVK